MSISEVRENEDAVITAIQGDTRFMSRITSIGLTPGCKISVIKNDKNRPLLVYTRDTMIALNRKECSGITEEEVKA
ncbi:ferrous iron transport protein A [Acetitomaculum ruminis DSM 5522]|uniref:Ferrous iron transport protein A n=1 Tax=Acetitomaculum ruminis DSM 5522 TaxID=1120918 RepID=A0A1I0XH45_9FIRM|nr:FeoA family protein [Acetitomaculum ruminis]SFB00301.1 ferrous iron transport protein A [Acetitomaculum ruminis DSM 5522]